MNIQISYALEECKHTFLQILYIILSIVSSELQSLESSESFSSKWLSSCSSVPVVTKMSVRSCGVNVSVSSVMDVALGMEYGLDREDLLLLLLSFCYSCFFCFCMLLSQSSVSSSSSFCFFKSVSSSRSD